MTSFGAKSMSRLKLNIINRKFIFLTNIPFISPREARKSTRGVQYVMKTAQYIPKFYIYTLNNYFHLKVCFLAK